MALHFFWVPGLTFLKPKVAKWRYSRGSRSLVTNLSKTGTTNQGEGDANECKHFPLV